jgi:3',5'-cyclic AMP phosphodiesterase CpdA
LSRKRRIAFYVRLRWPLVAIVIFSLLAILLWPVFTALPGDLGIQKRALINELIYPTFGNPAIVKKGTNLTIEFDPRNRAFDEDFVKLKDFDVSVETSNDPFPATMDLPIRSVKVGVSTHWPEYAKANDKIYLITVEVPEELIDDLYDILMAGTNAEGERVIDTQPHALKAVENFHDTFTFAQLTDIHMYGPECEYPSANYHLRSQRSDGSTSDKNKQGAVYYQNVIQQINLEKPEFCVMTGDFMFGQSYFLRDQGSPWGITTEYEYEQMWFYEETMKLDVPVYLGLGNHDSFTEGNNAAHEDWFENWRRMYGPTYYAFDYGDYHFQMWNSQDWPVKERALSDYGVSIQSDKYKGQIRGGGDLWSPGSSIPRMNAIDETKFTGQLKWIHDDLKSHMSSKMRIVGTHQDPWRSNGSGGMWASAGSDSTGFIGGIKSMMGFAGKYGNGTGRLAAAKMLLEYDVALELSGHYHSDHVEWCPWFDGNGATFFVNTTCTQFNTDGLSRSYPGYRRIEVVNGQLASVNYQDPDWSYPIYAETRIGQVNNLGAFSEPALQSVFVPEPTFSEDVSLWIGNALKKPFRSTFTKVTMPYLNGGYYYQVTNGRVRSAHDDNDVLPGYRVFEIRADVGANSNTQVRIAKSAAPDKDPPGGTVLINGGAPVTNSLAVTLTLSGVDSASGIKDVLVSESPDFKGARWTPWRDSLDWTLNPAPPGRRTLYVMFRDYAMPPNVSAPVQASINCTVSK